MGLEILGAPPLEHDAEGRPKARVATIFPKHKVLITLPGIHAWQRNTFLARLNKKRSEQGLPPLTSTEEERELASSVDLIIETDQILIRPDPAHMRLAFEADELLQEIVSKRRIKFLFAMDDRVQKAIKARGECWRIAALPQSRDGMRKLIEESKVAIREQPIYYYNRLTGTKYVTCAEFERLEALDAPELARQLDEIAEYSGVSNQLGNPEVDFFAADPLRFSAREFTGIRFAGMPAAELKSKYDGLKASFLEAVPPELRADDFRAESWRGRMFSALVSQRDETLTEEVLRGLSPEFFLQIEWLPGGRLEEGEFIFDAVFDEADRHSHDEALVRLCDPSAKGFIFNFIREYSDLEYVNVGRIVSSLSARPLKDGRRGVYIAELKLSNAPKPIVRFIRMQKWGIRERLDEGKGLLEAIIQSEEYTNYILDRRLGCRQLGMNLPPRVNMRRLSEVYNGSNLACCGQAIWATYSERDYIQGIATDKIPSSRYANDTYALRLAWLLGNAAASNIIVGRAYEKGNRVIFDDGDEVVVEGADGLPQDLVVSDHSGAFDDYTRPLQEFAWNYAKPVNSRLAFVRQPRQFAEAYLAAFLDGFLRIQGDYRKRRRAFDTLFKHCRYDPAGSFAYRWECVLKRMNQTDAQALTNSIRQHITALGGDQK
jgi:hypothetical protein